MARHNVLGASLAAAIFLGTFSSIAEPSLLTTNYSYGSAFSNLRSMARLSDGTLAFAYQKGSPASAGNGLVLVTSEDNGASWNQVLQIAAINNVFPDIVAGPGRSLYVVYSTNSDGAGSKKDASFAKVEYDASTGTWKVARTSFIVDATTLNGAFNAVIASEGGLLWSAMRYYGGAGYSVRVYVSADDGATWSYALEADAPGPNADETAVFATFGGKLALIYYHQNYQFRSRVRDIGSPTGSWGASRLIYQVTSELGSKSGYSAVVDDQDEIHLVFSQRGIKHLRTSGGVWQGVPIVVSASGSDPAVATDGRDLWVVWQNPIGTDQYAMPYQRYDGASATWDPMGGSFQHPSERLPEAAWCYSATAGTWSDVTLGAGNKSKYDVVNASTLQTLRDPGDALYVGMSVPFSYLRVLLGTKGIGGESAWEYWNGTAWTVFIPTFGPYHFEAGKDLRLWPTIGEGPADWSTLSVNGSSALYYVRARATLGYSTAPRATQITSYERNRFAAVVPRDPAGLTLSWTRGKTGPYTIETRGTVAWTDIGGGTPLLAGRMAARAFSAPAGPGLHQNFPNPFNPRTTIRFSLATAGPVRLNVYDVQGRTVATLAEGAYAAGTHEVAWDGRTRSGVAASSGVYWYRLEANGARATRRMTLLQ